MLNLTTFALVSTLLLSVAHAEEPNIAHPGGTLEITDSVEAADFISAFANAGYRVQNWDPRKANPDNAGDAPKGDITLELVNVVCRKTLMWGKSASFLNPSAKCDGLPVLSSYIVMEAIRKYAARDEMSEPGTMIFTIDKISCRVKKGEYGSFDYRCTIKYPASGLHE